MDHRYQKNGKPRAFKREQQDYYYEQRGQDADSEVIVDKRGGKIVIAGGVAHKINVLGIEFCGLLVDSVQKIKGFLPLLGKIEVNKYTAVIVRFKLEQSVVQRFVKLVESIFQIAVQVYVAFFRLVVSEHKHIDQRNAVL